MPDHGVRMPSYLSGNESMGILGQAPYGWYGTPAYRADQLPENDYFPAAQFAYERVDWSRFVKQIKSLNNAWSSSMRNYTNPPFLGASQMLAGLAPDGSMAVPSWMRLADGGIARILRGHVRRQTDLDPTNPAHFVRLHFMWNPDHLVREYVSWGEQGALDPSGALGTESDEAPLAPYGMSHLGFQLYFDRQLEVATIPHHPGVLVDLQAFDMLAGDAVQKGTNTTGIPDPDRPGNDTGIANVDVAENAQGGANYVSRGSGNYGLNPNVMLSVVLSPTMAFDGRLASAQVTFTKFSHRMVPTAMRLDFTIILSRIGNMTKQSAVLSSESALAAAAAPYDPTSPEFVPPANKEEAARKMAEGIAVGLAWADQQVGKLNSEGAHKYGGVPQRNDGPPCNDKPFRADCSSFIWRIFHVVGWNGVLNIGDTGPDNPCGAVGDTTRFKTAIEGNSRNTWFLPGGSIEYAKNHWKNVCDLLTPGDVFVRPLVGEKTGHIVMFTGYNNWDDREDMDKKCMNIIHCTPSEDGGGVVKARRSPKEMVDSYHLIGKPCPYGLEFDMKTLREYWAGT